jgi:hypothetical protein
LIERFLARDGILGDRVHGWSILQFVEGLPGLDMSGVDLQHLPEAFLTLVSGDQPGHHVPGIRVAGLFLDNFLNHLETGLFFPRFDRLYRPLELLVHRLPPLISEPRKPAGLPRLM